VIDACWEVTGLQIWLEVANRWEGDPPVLVAGADKAKNMLNWQPQYDLTEIVRTAWYWEKNRKFAQISEQV
jgi:UDP-glucose 4-epimerase